MNLNEYLDEVDFQSFNTPHWSDSKNCLGTLLRQNHKKIAINDAQLVIIGIKEDRNEFQKGSAEGPDHIRKELYALTRISPLFKIRDLGNIKLGPNITDSYQALIDVCSYFSKQQIPLVIIGGSQDLTISMLKAIKKQSCNTVIIDSLIDFQEDIRIQNADNFLAPVLKLVHPSDSVTALGYQNYLTDESVLDKLHKQNFNTVRLGYIRKYQEEAEPYLRDADLISFDIQSVRFGDAPGQYLCSPNGLHPEEICQLTHYAGLSPKNQIAGFFNYIPSRDQQDITARLIAQIIWHYLHGIYFRVRETPSNKPENFREYIIKMPDTDLPLIFYYSYTTQRWWIKINKLNPEDEDNFIACSANDYQIAAKGEIPSRWLSAL